MKGLLKRSDRRRARAEDVKWIKKDFHDHIMNWRLPQMWMKKPYGLVKGQYGKGTARWAPNAASTVKSKGFNKPMFSSRGRYGSRILKSYRWSAWSHRPKRARNARFQFKLWNDREYAQWLNDGAGNYPARRCTGFFDGDGTWLRKHTAKKMMAVGGLDVAAMVRT